LSSIWMTDSHVITKVNKIVFAATDTIHHWRAKALRGQAQRSQLCIGHPAQISSNDAGNSLRS
jgi:hypothetical protein